MSGTKTLDFEYTGDFPVASVAYAGEGIVATICYQEDSSFCDPRGADNLGTMFVEYDGYELGDKDADDPREQLITCPFCEGSGYMEHGDGIATYAVYCQHGYGKILITTFEFKKDASRFAEVRNDKPVDGTVYMVEDRECRQCEGTGEIEVDLYDYLKREHGARVALPLFVHEHGMMTMRSGAPFGSFDPRNRIMGDAAGWDTSSAGVIYDTADMRETWGCDHLSDDEIREALESEVETYSMYLEGQCYWYTIEFVGDDALDEFGESIIASELARLDGEMLDSCGGFVGDEYVAEAATEAAAYEVKQARERCERNEAVERGWRW